MNDDIFADLPKTYSDKLSKKELSKVVSGLEQNLLELIEIKAKCEEQIELYKKHLYKAFEICDVRNMEGRILKFRRMPPYTQNKIDFDWLRKDHPELCESYRIERPVKGYLAIGKLKKEHQ